MEPFQSLVGFTTKARILFHSRRPDPASAFDDFILRILADRIDFANHAIDALNR